MNLDHDQKYHEWRGNKGMRIRRKKMKRFVKYIPGKAMKRETKKKRGVNGWTSHQSLARSKIVSAGACQIRGEGGGRGLGVLPCVRDPVRHRTPGVHGRRHQDCVSWTWAVTPQRRPPTRTWIPTPPRLTPIAVAGWPSHRLSPWSLLVPPLGRRAHGTRRLLPLAWDLGVGACLSGLAKPGFKPPPPPSLPTI